MIFTPTEKEVVDAAKEVVKTKQKSQRKSDLMSVHTNPGDNSKYIHHALTFLGWQKPDMTNAEAVRQRVLDYFNTCDANDMKPSIESLALAFGVNRKTIWSWVNDGEGTLTMPVESLNMIKSAHRAINAMLADYMQDGKINPIPAIFLMKNNMGYSDQTEVVITPNNPLGAETSAEEVQKRITAGVVIDVPEDE